MSGPSSNTGMSGHGSSPGQHRQTQQCQDGPWSNTGMSRHFFLLVARNSRKLPEAWILHWARRPRVADRFFSVFHCHRVCLLKKSRVLVEVLLFWAVLGLFWPAASAADAAVCLRELLKRHGRQIRILGRWCVKIGPTHWAVFCREPPK